MNVRRLWRSLGFFWKAFLFLVALTASVVALAEGVLEPLAEDMLVNVSGGFKPWHEAVMWMVSIVVPSLISGYVFTRMLTARLNRMAAAATRLAGGDLAARIPSADDSPDAFGQLARSFNNMADALEKVVVNERRLLADISHELRTPLARMNMALALLPLKQDPPARAVLEERLEKEVERMGKLVNLLLAQGRDRLAGPGETVVLDVSAMVAEIADDVRFQGQAQDKQVTSAIIPGCRMNGNAGQLRTMVTNVAANALFYTAPGTSVAIHVSREDGHIRITIRDHGPGVPENQLEDIFRAFYRVDDSRTRESGGVGLGLALARDAAVNHGGMIAARNAFPGLEVCMRLPALPEAGPGLL